MASAKLAARSIVSEGASVAWCSAQPSAKAVSPLPRLGFGFGFGLGFGLRLGPGLGLGLAFGFGVAARPSP